MKLSTMEWIILRATECECTLRDIEQENPEQVKSKRYWGIEQELNTLNRIQQMELNNNLKSEK